MWNRVYKFLIELLFVLFILFILAFLGFLIASALGVFTGG